MRSPFGPYGLVSAVFRHNSQTPSGSTHITGIPFGVLWLTIVSLISSRPRQSKHQRGTIRYFSALISFATVQQSYSSFATSSTPAGIHAAYPETSEAPLGTWM